MNASEKKEVGSVVPQEEGEKIKLRIIREPGFAPMTTRKRDVCWNFGIPPREAPYVIADDLAVTLRPGSIILLTGPSGSGKTTILNAIAGKVERPIWVGRGRFPADRAIVDAVAPRKPLAVVLEILTACGLGEPRLWVRQFADLSDGERFRAGLARAVGNAIGHDDPRPRTIFCDEFSAILHRRTAKAVAYSLRKLVTRHRLTLVVATTHDDILEDLQPNETLRLHGPDADVIAHRPRRKGMSLRRRTTIERGSVSDYRTFSPMHYRHRDGLGFVDKVFLLKERGTGAPLGILVFAHAPMELTLRNRSTRGRFVRNVRRLNRELRILRRLVMHPDVRGCGLGHWFVRKTLPQVGVRFIECLAAMGEVNPVFEKAGMHRVGRCPLPKGRMKLLERMKAWNLDPFASDFSKKIARYPRVRSLVEETIRSWVRALHGKIQYKIEGKRPDQLSQVFRQLIGSPPIYYLWDRNDVYPILDNADENDPDESSASIARHDLRRHDPRNRKTPGHRSGVRGKRPPGQGRSKT
ncbi:MAG: ATP-binding cassette domain-containing protein [Phycisphaerales bacterium]|nr:ATP-binding cassette domain-containing protein [Phycisphaerales bacterium]